MVFPAVSHRGRVIWHRDLHAGNVLVKLSGNEDRAASAPSQIQGVKVADFGKACLVVEREAGANIVPFTAKNSPHYVAAPEIVFRRGAVWAGGIVENVDHAV